MHRGGPEPTKSEPSNSVIDEQKELEIGRVVRNRRKKEDGEGRFKDAEVSGINLTAYVPEGSQVWIGLPT